ncbi:hypothetical pox protein [Squirrelpox virus]|uniref:Hypothetical pox protein n=1 Tax=Squirrelpox virus TaxID=240426 RepID=Q1HTU4_9POXV|nr:hypothetical pox protein [Squirrelpox virus]ABD51442.1 I6L [Squirrelpox virus]CCD83191.1 hypothetical pox protein [Squirrelpox virus]
MRRVNIVGIVVQEKNPSHNGGRDHRSTVARGNRQVRTVPLRLPDVGGQGDGGVQQLSRGHLHALHQEELMGNQPTIPVGILQHFTRVPGPASRRREDEGSRRRVPGYLGSAATLNTAARGYKFLDDDAG